MQPLISKTHTEDVQYSQWEKALVLKKEKLKAPKQGKFQLKPQY